MRRPTESETGVLEVLESSIHLLRAAPPATFLWYYAGAVPFVLTFLFVWTRMTRPGIAASEVAGLALLLTVLFVWMKTAQAWFAARLTAAALDAPAPELTVGRLLSVARRQIRHQIPALLWLPLSLPLVVPFAWAHAYAQNLCVLSGDTTQPDAILRRRARAQALHWPLQNHLAVWLVSPWLSIATVAMVFGSAYWFMASDILHGTPVSFLTVLFIVVILVWPCSPFGFVVAANLAAVVLALPFLLESVSGIRTASVISPLAAIGNTTFLAVVMGLTYLVLDPLMKVVYVLRCIRSASLYTGADLLASLRRVTPILPVLLCGLFTSGIAWADTTSATITPPARPAPSAAISAAALDRAIEQVLRDPCYQWPIPGREIEKAEADEKTSWLADFLGAAGDWLYNLWEKLSEGLRRLVERLMPLRASASDSGPVDSSALLIFVFAVLAVVLCLAALLYYRGHRRKAVIAMNNAAVVPASDVADETVMANALPPDEWLAKADELAAHGEWRLAVRALFLSALSTLHAASLVRVGRHKTNRDYLGELDRHGHDLPVLVKAFVDILRMFEGSWYGDHAADEAQFAQCRGNMEAIRRHGLTT